MNLLDKLLPKRVIVNCEREPYLHRWYLFRSEPLGIFIHKFVRSDEDRALHDHPWAFIVIPLWRGYIEHSEKREFSHDIEQIVRNSCDQNDIWIEGCDRAFAPQAVRKRVYPIIGTRFRPGTYRHRVELFNYDWTTKPAPAWSIFIRFKKFRDWGFWTTEGFVQWNKWWQDKCE